MKVALSAVIISLCISGCSSSQINVAKNNLTGKNTISVNLVSKEIKLTFNIKDVQNFSRIKSIDAYLVNNFNSPMLASSNIYNDGYKYQTNINNGVINISFNNYPAGGPYYLALQVYDDFLGSSVRNNITAVNSAVVSGDKQVICSTNSVTYNSGLLTYSDFGNTLNVLIKLIPFNSPLLNITPENGSTTPTNGIYVGY